MPIDSGMNARFSCTTPCFLPIDCGVNAHFNWTRPCFLPIDCGVNARFNWTRPCFLPIDCGVNAHFNWTRPCFLPIDCGVNAHFSCTTPRFLPIDCGVNAHFNWTRPCFASVVASQSGRSALAPAGRSLLAELLSSSLPRPLHKIFSLTQAVFYTQWQNVLSHAAHAMLEAYTVLMNAVMRSLNFLAWSRVSCEIAQCSVAHRVSGS